jgi:hypothetical protein
MPRLLPKRYAAATGTIIAALFVVAVPIQPASAEFRQQGPKLVGTGASGNSIQGSSVALSADGNTLLVGASGDAGGAGAAWVFVRSNGVWTQQGGKLFGAGAVGAAQGRSVALSADGNTAIVGGDFDNSSVGAAWVFVRNNGVWSPQGGKLVGTGAVGAPFQGRSVALSADGNTLLVGGPGDAANVGAAWVFTRAAGNWTQQGSKLVGAGNVGNPAHGESVALSGDGNTAIISGTQDSGGVGAAWVFNRNAGTWSQFGNKLVGTGATSNQGHSVALSADGKTAILGGAFDSSNGINHGAAWIFVFNGSSWTQQGGKLVGSGAVGSSNQGTSVSLSGDGDTAIIGGPSNANNLGAAWVFGRSNGAWSQLGLRLVGTQAVGAGQQGASVALSADGTTAAVGGKFDSPFIGASWVWLRHVPHDLSADGRSDILWRHSDGTAAAWLMNGTAISSSASFGIIPQAWQIVGQRDFNGDGKHDLLWRDSGGTLAMWFLNGAGGVSSTAAVGSVSPSWRIDGTADANVDGKGDLLWRNTSTGEVAIWLMNGASVLSTAGWGVVPLQWEIKGFADINGDSRADILWRNASTGEIVIWFLDGTEVITTGEVGTVSGGWNIVATGDLNGDGKADLVWRDASGSTAVWLMNGSSPVSKLGYGVIAGGWTVTETGDFDGNGKADILWRNTSTGDTAIWFMNGTSVASSATVANVLTTWVIQSTNAN